MIQKINTTLKPVENFLLQNKKYIGYGILAMSVFAIYFYQSYKLSLQWAEIAMILLWILLWMPIFSRVFGIKVFAALMGFRKEIGIVMGIFSLVHFSHMFSMLGYYFEKNLPLALLGIIPQIIIFLLTITSNDISKKILGKNWKKLHRMVYIVPLLIVLQIGLAQEFEVLPIVILIAYYFFKILEWKNLKFFTEEKINYPKWQKFLCVPCGYIYDPVKWDIEDGIAPGTEFIDIPDNWRCPECGVTKADFIPYDENNQIQAIKLKIFQKIFLNPTTIELILEKPENFSPKIGQFATFEYEDENSKFRRQYSVAKNENGKIHFLIKLKKDGRGAKILQEIAQGENMNFIGFFGDFILQENENPKIFIATGTGLAPIYYMMNNSLRISKKLFMSVATKDEIFYKNELESIENLEINYHVTREDVEWFRSGRMVSEEIIANMPKNTEFYLCGAPAMVENTVNFVKNSGFEKVYYEEFN